MVDLCFVFVGVFYVAALNVICIELGVGFDAAFGLSFVRFGRLCW